MDTFIVIVQVLAAVAGSLVALLTIPLFLKLRWPAPVLWFVKLYSAALSVLLAGIAILVTVTGILTGSVFISLVGLYGLVIYVVHIIRVTRPPAAHTGFKKAFGEQWENRLPAVRKKYFLPRRFTFGLPAVPEPRFQQNICFAIIPGSGRQLLCDIWQPHAGVPASGLALIYMHGSAFYFLDKDFSTRPFFRQLAAQGHVIMDVAYRLAPETDITGMVHDVNRAIHWMKENAGRYNVDPAKIVVSGASAGGHLALLSAYTARHPRFTPPGLEGKDTSVCGVISLYGSNDLTELYYHTNQHLTTRSLPGQPTIKVPTKVPAWLTKKMGKDYRRLGMDKDFKDVGALAPLLGGHPDEVPGAYAMVSPATHIHANCPPTLLIHDEDDIMAPVKTTRSLYLHLAEYKIPTVLHILPQTDHGFDLILPAWSPAAHNVLYDVERFLALMQTGGNLAGDMGRTGHKYVQRTAGITKH